MAALLASDILTYVPSPFSENWPAIINLGCIIFLNAGELVGIKLSGTCSEAKARLDINTLAMPDTLIGQKTAW